MSRDLKKIENYNFTEVEQRWRKMWENDTSLFNTEYKNKYYVLEMFPYPSGYLHIGHILNYTIGDVVARYKKMNGFDVLRPMGWDAFGLPAENAAIERKRHPDEWTKENINKMRSQIKDLGFMIDWSREIATCDPEYYKHEQKMFIDFYKNGLAYQKESIVNWDPIDQTVLANEQVVDGKGWRSGAIVEKKNLKQWFLKITDYAEELLTEIQKLTGWPEKIRTMQTNWIGKSEGAEVEFEISNFIETENFVLRPINAGDLDNLFSLYSDADVMKYSQKYCKTKAEAEKFLNEYIAEWEKYGVGKYAIFCKNTGEFVGRGGNSFVENSRYYSVSLGYFLHKKFQGKGFGAEVSRAICAKTFDKYNEIGIAIMPGNTASEKLAQKLGAKLDKEIEINGIKYNNFLLLKNDFKQEIKYETADFIIREFRSIDAENLFKLHSDPEVVKYVGTPAENLEDVKKSIEKYRKWYEEWRFSSLAVFCKKTGEFVGRAGLTLTDPKYPERAIENAIEIGYVLHKKFWNKGYGTKLATYFINWAFESKKTEKICLMTSIENIASQKIAKKLGGVIIKTVDTDRYGKEFVFAIEKQDFYAKNQALLSENINYDENKNKKIKIFTTRPDTLFGASFVAISPNHPIAEKIAKTSDEIRGFIEKCKLGSVSEAEVETREKEGIFTGIYCKNPAFEIAKSEGFEVENAKIPVWIANFVLMEYGTGAIFGCPAHDERDFEFAKKYELEIKQVLKLKVFDNAAGNNISQFNNDITKLPFTDINIQSSSINSHFLNELDITNAKQKMIKMLEKYGFGNGKITYRLKDWGVSRQRYWGCPIPMVYCDFCGTVPEKYENLPIELPQDVIFDGRGNPLANHPTWKNCKCPKCEKDAIRETDTFDTFFESSWYFLRFCDPKNKTEAFDKKVVENLMPVDQYIGGAEHAVMHLLYARFFTKALAKCGYFNKNICDNNEPFTRLLNQGMVLHQTYKDKEGNWLYPWEIYKKDGKFYHEKTNDEVVVGSAIKMSKSKRNVIDPAEVLEIYGADAIRLFMMSDSPVDRDLEWSANGVEACLKYINKLWKMANIIADCEKNEIIDTSHNLFKKMHQTIKDARFQMEKFEFNKTIAKVRELHNLIDEVGFEDRTNHNLIFEAFKTMILILHPIIPHISSEIATLMEFSLMEYPNFDEKFIHNDKVTMAIQINGKIRAEIVVDSDISDEDCLNLAMQNEKVQKYLDGKNIKKSIVVKGKLVSFSVVD